MSGNRPTLIGILGAAAIAPRSLLAPAAWVETPCAFAVAARDRPRAERFAAEHGIHRVFDDYDALLASADVDAVYLPLPNALHRPWAIRAMEAGKPVLVEKPLCLGCEELDALAAVSDARGVPLVEAAMVRHHPWQQRLRGLIEDGRLGRLRAVKTRLCMDIRDAAADDFRWSAALGGGAWLDLGPYWIQFMQACVGLDLHDLEVRAEVDAQRGVDTTCAVRARCAADVDVDCLCSFTQPFAASHQLELERGRLGVRNIFRPAFGQQVLWIDVEDDAAGTKEKVKLPAQNYYANQLAGFIAVVRGEAAPEPLAAVRERVAVLETVHRAFSG